MTSLPPVVQKWMTLLMPPMAAVVCCSVMVPRQNRLKQVRIDIGKTEAQTREYLRQLEEIKKLPPDPTVATLPMAGQEQSDFLRGLTTLCARTGNRIITVSSLAAPSPSSVATAATSSAAKDNPAPTLPEGVVEINTTISFDGSFGSLRSFLAGLRASRRLIGVIDCRTSVSTKGYPQLRTSVSVVRYVDAPPEYLEAQKKETPKRKPAS